MNECECERVIMRVVAQLEFPRKTLAHKLEETGTEMR